MAYNYQIIKWMYFPVLFPLFCLALRRLLLDGKGGWYAVLLGYQLMLSIQLGFMTLLFVLFGSGIFFFLCKSGVSGMGEERKGRKGVRAAVKENGEKAQRTMCRLGLYTIVALLLSSVVLVPNIQVLLTSARAQENLSYFDVMKQHGLDDLFERLFQIAQPVLLALFVWAFVGWRRGKGRFARLPEEGKFWFLLNAFLWLTVLLQPANLLWHMGSYVCFPVRYAYMVLLAGIGLTKWLLTEAEPVENPAEEPAGGMRPIALCAPILCLAACALTCLWEDRIVQAFSSLAISRVCPKETGMVCLILLLFFLAGLCALPGNRRRRRNQGKRAALRREAVPGRGTVPSRAALLCVTAFCGLCLNLFIFLPADYSVRISNEAAYQKMTEQAAHAEKTETEGENAVLQRVKDDPDLPLNAALVNRQSSLSGYVPTTNLGFQETMEALGYLVPWVATQSVGGTAVSDDLLSMALLLDGEASALVPEGDSVLERQKELTELAGGTDCFVCLAGDDLETDADGALLLTVEEERMLYLDPAMTADGFRIFVNGAVLEVPEAESAYSAHRIVALGSFADETVAVLVTDRSGTVLPAENMEIGMLDMRAWENAKKALRQLGGTELEMDISSGCIRISLEDEEAGQTVYLPFAALPGWRATINGEAAEIGTVLGGFLGVATQDGTQEIVLRFLPPGLGNGALFTILGAACLAAGARMGTCFTGRSKWLARLMRRLYEILFAGGVLLIYLVPALGLICYMAAKVLAFV